MASAPSLQLSASPSLLRVVRFASLGTVCLSAALILNAPAALADVPPPDGQTRVHYSIKVSGAPAGNVVVASPMSTSDGSSVAVVNEGQEMGFFQGYVPTVYTLPSADLVSVQVKGPEALTALKSKALVCIQKVPRVFQVPTTSRVTKMVDVFQIEVSQGACKATLVKTLYSGASGESGEGGVDASGKRTAPAPFLADELPPTGDTSLSPKGAASPNTNAGASPVATGTAAPMSDQPANAPAASQGGCAGCSSTGIAASGMGGVALAALAALTGRRARKKTKRSR
ncbi:MAG: hypothetical protein IPK82_28205 [Polyangiaceae bacterium]|nr:hypothetical protein [Polyangiaceae bacterium]